MDSNPGKVAVKPEHHGRDHIMTGLGLLAEYLAEKYGIALLAWTGAAFLFLAFLSYTRHHLSRKHKMWAYPCGALLLCIVTLVVTGIHLWPRGATVSVVQQEQSMGQNIVTPQKPVQTMLRQTQTRSAVKHSVKKTQPKPTLAVQKNLGGQNNTNTQIGTAQAPVAIAPNGIANTAPNLGTQTVSNTFSDTYPRPGTVPDVNFCISKTQPFGDHYETVMTIETDTDITAPFWGLFFDGPVTGATIAIPGINEPFGSSSGHPSFSQGVSLPPLGTLPVQSRLLLTTTDESTTISPDDILRIQITEIGYPFGGPFRPWGAGDRITVTVRSRQSVQLLAITSGYRTELLEENMTTRCD